jgi:hypothetical protein
MVISRHLGDGLFLRLRLRQLLLHAVNIAVRGRRRMGTETILPCAADAAAARWGTRERAEILFNW